MKKYRTKRGEYMDNRETVLKSIEDDTIKFIKASFSERYQETWSVDYSLNDKNYSFSISFDKTEKIKISCVGSYLDERVEERFDVSRITHKLVDALKKIPKFKLKIMLKQCQIYFVNDKYLIYDVDNFETRKTKKFIDDHKDSIEMIFKKCLSLSKSSYKRDELFLVIKEEDELPLFDFLVSKNFMTHIASFNSEEYLKLNAPFSCNQRTFYDVFTEEMKSLGYNLYYDTYTGDDYYNDYDDNSYYDYLYYSQEDEWEEYFDNNNKKKRR